MTIRMLVNFWAISTFLAPLKVCQMIIARLIWLVIDSANLQRQAVTFSSSIYP